MTLTRRLRRRSSAFQRFDHQQHPPDRDRVHGSHGSGLSRLGGTLAPASDGGVWSSATYANDTLTISPVSVWSNGAGTLTVNVADRVGNPLAALNVSFTVDATLPTAGVSPANGSILANTTQIVITFSESMDTGTLSVSGMDAKSSTWSTTVVANDTLTIRPATEWGVGTNRSLSVYAKRSRGQSDNRQSGL